MTPYGEYRIDLRQYLLGNVSEDTRRQVEILLLTENSVLEEVQLLEDELIDDYVSGDLPDQDRSLFEQNFLLTSERQQKLRASATLTQYARSKSTGRKHSLGERIRAFWDTHRMQLVIAGSTALLLLVFWAGGRIAFTNWGSGNSQTLASLNLTISGSTRGAGADAPKGVQLPPNVDGLRVSLELPAGLTPSGKYQAELESADGKIRLFEKPGQDGQTIVVIIPAEQLSRGQYALRVYSVQSDGTAQRINGNYFFNIE
jgi:hypothetical protein